MTETSFSAVSSRTRWRELVRYGSLFIYPPFQQLRGASGEGDDDTPLLACKEIDFSKDDSSALAMLLRIAHMKFEKIPASLS